MSLLVSPSAVRLSELDPDELEDVFHAWAHDPAKPDPVALGQHRHLPMVELARQLEGSQAVLGASACSQPGVPSGATIGRAVAELLHATVDPDGPRCRSFRSASYYLRGLIRLEVDPPAITDSLVSSTASTRGHPHVR